MATILFTWELGANLGHVTTIGPVARELSGRGHRVAAALRDLTNAAHIFRGSGVELLPACSHYAAKRQMVTYADLLANAGFADAPVLSAHVAAWRNMIRLVKPDVLVCDHSPTALLAGRCYDVPCVTLGTGFYVPPNECPLPALIPGESDIEHRVLDTVNLVLRANRRPAMERLADLYHNSTTHLLTTFPDLDHFGPRTDAEYFGPVCDAPGSESVSTRVFAYLRPFHGLEPLLTLLARRGIATTAVVPSVKDELRSKFHGTSVVLRSTPVELASTMCNASLSITHASHGATASSLMAGCPTLLFPTQTEQYMLGQVVERLGCGMIARPNGVAEALDRLLEETSYRAAAQAFANKCAGFAQIERIADRVVAA